MSVRRLAPAEVQPARFAFDPANENWAKAQLTKFPEGRQASAVIPLLWRAQEQEGWISEAAIVEIARLLGMPKIRVLEVATFYTMFNLEPVGRHFVQLCGTVPCHITGALELKEVCRRVIGPERHVTADGALSWLEVECLGACVNAPMAQINADYYEDLTPERFEWLLGELRAGRAPAPGPQNGRQLSAPLGGDTSLTDPAIYRGPSDSPTRGDPDAAITDVGAKRPTAESSQRASPAPPAEVAAAGRTESKAAGDSAPASPEEAPAARRREEAAASHGPHPPTEAAEAPTRGKPQPSPEHEALARTEEQAITAKLSALPKGASAEDKANAVGARPTALPAAREGRADKLQRIRGIGPVNEGKLHGLGVFHFDQIAGWTRDEIRWVGTYLAFPGRIDREDWVGQAKNLSSGGVSGKD